MSVVTRNVSEYVRKKGINLSELSRSTKIQYRASINTKRENRVSGRKERQAWKRLNYRQCRSWS